MGMFHTLITKMSPEKLQNMYLFLLHIQPQNNIAAFLFDSYYNELRKLYTNEC
jgi:hypothetical protein